ncbi:hypothetical protein [Bacillus swezeyi]|uniref:hypothetical protein n=2 Tax=Bacillus swezeyi TaxID=1925020 RepID=UPI001239D029|nr:hypothetical protein [Bacillus swezeyi]
MDGSCIVDHVAALSGDVKWDVSVGSQPLFPGDSRYIGFYLAVFPVDEAFFHTGFGIMASFLALAVICISKKRDGWRLKGLLIIGAVLQLIVWELISFLTAALYLLAAFLPGENTEALEKRADESVQ